MSTTPVEDLELVLVACEAELRRGTHPLEKRFDGVVGAAVVVLVASRCAASRCDASRACVMMLCGEVKCYRAAGST